MQRLSDMIKFTFNTSNLLLIRNRNKINKCIQNNFSRSTISFDKNNINSFELKEESERKKTPRILKVTLVYPDESTTVVSLEEAEKIAKHRNLDLLQTEYDYKSNRNIYKLVNSTELNNVVDTDKNSKKINQNKQKRITKLFTMKSKISDHDLNTKISNVNKILKKRQNVKIYLSHPNGDQEQVLKSIKNNIQGTISMEQLQKNATILVFSPSSDIESVFLKSNGE